MGKHKGIGKHKSRETLLKSKHNEQVLLDLMNDPTIVPTHISLYTTVSTEFPGTQVEDPIFIRDNLPLMALRIECYEKALESTIKANQDSLTDSVAELMTNNSYLSYLKTVYSHYNQK